MRRPTLATLVVLGTLISLIGSTGLFAALTDTAQTGTNSADSAALAASADIQLATATWDSTNGGYTCGTYAEDLATAVFTLSDLQAGFWGGHTALCLKNAGSQSVALSVTATELTDVDDACTGDEAEYDTSCGGGAAGELSPLLRASFSEVECATGNGSGSSPFLASLVTTPHPLSSAVAPGGEVCIAMSVMYPTATAADAVQRAQSDSVTWRFVFTADAS